MEHAVNLATSNMDLNHLLEGARHDGYRGHLAKLNLILVSVALPSLQSKGLTRWQLLMLITSATSGYAGM